MTLDPIRAREILDQLLVDPDEARAAVERVRTLLLRSAHITHEGKVTKLSLPSSEPGAIDGSALRHVFGGDDASAAPTLEYVLGFIVPRLLDFVDATKPELDALARE